MTDLLLNTEEGSVLVEHKTTTRRDYKRNRGNAQLEHYKRILHRMARTGERLGWPLQITWPFPLFGCGYRARPYDQEFDGGATCTGTAICGDCTCGELTRDA